MDEIKRLQEMVDESSSIVFFGGCRSFHGERHTGFPQRGRPLSHEIRLSAETILSHTFFMKNPEEFYRFYHDKMLCLDAKPNAAHKKLAEMEAKGKLNAVITQNIDGLHQMAGSQRVMELHGSVHRNYCMKCGAFYDARYMKEAEGVPRCRLCGGMIKPDVVLYEEGLDQRTLSNSVSFLSRADLLIIGGTSLAVYPAAP